MTPLRWSNPFIVVLILVLLASVIDEFVFVELKEKNKDTQRFHKPCDLTEKIVKLSKGV